jgi:hypothetical protein
MLKNRDNDLTRIENVFTKCINNIKQQFTTLLGKNEKYISNHFESFIIECKKQCSNLNILSQSIINKITNIVSQSILYIPNANYKNIKIIQKHTFHHLKLCNS